MKRFATLAAAIHLCSAECHAQQSDCRPIADSLERLRCYDANAGATTDEDPFIAKAKARIGQQLLDPPAARYSDIKMKTIAGKQGLCGQINARNGTGGMTGNLPFTYDGQFATIMVFSPGAGNPTSMSADILGVTLGTRLKAYEKWCK